TRFLVSLIYYLLMTENTLHPPAEDGWRQTHLGRLLVHAMRRFDERVLQLMDQCEAWGLVTREPDARDARARLVQFTPTGLDWLQAFKDAVVQAEAEF